MQKEMRVVYDNKFFDGLFPRIKQQKPGKDLYVWVCFISVWLCLYVILFYTQMAG